MVKKNVFKFYFRRKLFSNSKTNRYVFLFSHYASRESSSAKKLAASFVPFSPDLIWSWTSSAASSVYLFGCGITTSNGKPPRKRDCFKNNIHCIGNIDSESLKKFCAFFFCV